MARGLRVSPKVLSAVVPVCTHRDIRAAEFDGRIVDSVVRS